MNDPTTIYQVLGFAVALGGVMWAVMSYITSKNERVHTRIDEVEKAHEDHRVYIAEHYMKKEEVARIEAKLDKLQESITTVLAVYAQGMKKD